MRFAIFPLHVSKILRLPRKSDARSYEVLHLSHKIIFPNLKIWCSKMQQEISARTSYITSLMNMSLVPCLPLKMHLCISSSSVPRLPLFLKLLQILTFCSRLTRCKKTLRQPRKTLLFSSLLWLFPPLLFHQSILPEVWLLNFLRTWPWLQALTTVAVYPVKLRPQV